MSSRFFCVAVLAHLAFAQAAPLDVDAFTQTALLSPRQAVCRHAVDTEDHKCFEGCTTGV